MTQPTRRETASQGVCVAYLALSFYTLGCLAVENDVNYAAWIEVGAQEFPSFHRAMEAGLKPVMFLPLTLQLIAGALLVWLRPRWLSLRWAVAALALHTYVIAESMLVQVPLHQALAQAKSIDSLNQLLSTHRLYRLPAELAAAAVDVVLLWTTVAYAQRAAPSPHTRGSGRFPESGSG